MKNTKKGVIILLMLGVFTFVFYLTTDRLPFFNREVPCGPGTTLEDFPKIDMDTFGIDDYPEVLERNKSID